MTRISDPTAGRSLVPTRLQDQSLASRSSQLEINSYQSMDAGLTIKTREGDVVTLSASRFSGVSARESNSQQTVSAGGSSASASVTQRQIQLSSGESFSFSVKGDLSEEELADIESIVSGIDGIIYDMAGGDMQNALSKALSMGSYDTVAGYEADISVTRSYSAYAAYSETRSNSGFSGGALQGFGSILPSAVMGDFTDEVSKFLEEQKDAALAHAQSPLSQLFDHYLAQVDALKDEADTADTGTIPSAAAVDEADTADTAADTTADTAQAAAQGDRANQVQLTIKTLAKTVDQMIQERVKNLFGNTLNQMV